MNWDDLRYLLALQRAGTLSSAARDMDVSHATVARRVEAFEETTPAPVFEKSPDGYVLTEFGAELLPALESIEDQIMRIERISSAWDDSPSGRVRLAFPGFLAPLLTGALVVHLHELNPEITMDIVDGQRFMNLREQEADLAVRIYSGDSFDDDPNLKLRMLGEMQWSIYGSEQFCEDLGLSFEVESFEDVPFVTFNDVSPADPINPWLREHGHQPAIAAACSSLNATLSCISDGIGAGPLPDFVGHSAGLVKLTQSITTYRGCLVMHPDMQRSSRVRAVADATVDFFAGPESPFQ